MLADAAANHRAWFARGREAVELPGVTLYLGAHGAVLAFPEPDAELDAAVRLAREARVREVGCWSLAPDEHLGAALQALGFQDGWQPHWMGLDPASAHDGAGLRVEASDDCAPDLPYAHAEPLGGDARHFVVRRGGRVVGHAVLHVAGATGGLYDMGVAPDARRRGAGGALARAVAAAAREAGCRSLTLNATAEGEPVYRAAGFVSLGLGMTWWLFPSR